MAIGVASSSAIPGRPLISSLNSSPGPDSYVSGCGDLSGREGLPAIRRPCAAQLLPIRALAPPPPHRRARLALSLRQRASLLRCADKDQARRRASSSAFSILTPFGPSMNMTACSRGSRLSVFRCSALASCRSAPTSRSLAVIRMTGIAFGQMGFDTAFAEVVRKR